MKLTNCWFACLGWKLQLVKFQPQTEVSLHTDVLEIYVQPRVIREGISGGTMNADVCHGTSVSYLVKHADSPTWRIRLSTNCIFVNDTADCTPLTPEFAANKGPKLSCMESCPPQQAWRSRRILNAFKTTTFDSR